MMLRWALLIGLALAASGCAGSGLPKIGPLASDKVIPTETPSPHCQYREPRTHRCYYYDPTVRKYFWANGTPKS